VAKPALKLTTEDRFGAFADWHRGSSKFNTARRAFTILDLVSCHEGLTAKALARELGVSLSPCLLLPDQHPRRRGFVEKIAYRKGYRLGPRQSPCSIRGPASCGRRLQGGAGRRGARRPDPAGRLPWGEFPTVCENRSGTVCLLFGLLR
jgi:hypothetical protein